MPVKPDPVPDPLPPGPPLPEPTPPVPEPGPPVPLPEPRPLPRRYITATSPQACHQLDPDSLVGFRPHSQPPQSPVFPARGGG
jgi:hypothetical protein